MKDALKIVILVFLFFSKHANASKIVVCKSCPLSTIRQGIAIAKVNDTILVKKGTYKEHHLIIDKAITLKGSDYPVIDGGSKGEIIKVLSDNVTIDGLFLVNTGRSYTIDYAAVRVVKSKNFVIKNLILKQLFFGVYLEKSSNGKVFQNKITGDAKTEYNSGNGIHLWYSKNVELKNNVVSHMRDGIYFEFVTDCVIKNNISSDNLRYGLHFMFSNNDRYEENTFKNNGAGVAVMFSRHIYMSKNVFRDNHGTASYGILLKEINDAEITGNTFEKNTIGIHIEGSNRIRYSNNNFINNGWAIKVRGACYDNVFFNNNFLYNSFDVSYSGNLNDNEFSHNYWSGYTGYDLDKDGIGDIPYRPVKLFSYIVNRSPEAIILLKSLFIDIIDFAEKVSPVFTPDNLMDHQPLMKKNDSH